MPTALVRGVHIHYEVLGTSGPWVALMPGGRRDLEGVRVLGERVAGGGYRVLLHDRRNCGASDVAITDDESEPAAWADDLYELLRQLDAAPAYIGGGSSGCRTSLLFAIRHPRAVRGLLLWWPTGGHFAAQRLAREYYTQYIEAAEAGGMAAVCATPFFAERVAANPSNRARLLGMESGAFVERMARWRRTFLEGGDLPVIGATESELRAVEAPACIVPGRDDTHPHAVAERLHALLPHSELVEVYADGEPATLLAAGDQTQLVARQRQLAEVFVPFLARAETASTPR